MSNKKKKTRNKKPVKPGSVTRESGVTEQPGGELIYAQEYRGPLPHPGMLKEYDSVVPGAADRILASFERQQEHRQALEKRVVFGGSRRAAIGQILGFLIALAFLAAAVFLVQDGHAVAGIILGTVDLVALVSVFVYSARTAGPEKIDP